MQLYAKILNENLLFISYITAAEMEVYFSQRRTFDEKMH